MKNDSASMTTATVVAPVSRDENDGAVFADGAGEGEHETGQQGVNQRRHDHQ